ncbi:hypothetical protein GLOTRDRAFT_128303 [Gloeophyllum trabeum ATCC 11539]|uniref:Zn(2)-C6 fungal-type domain-containing protein n=1 Tax=Gloeophyllum trabeum (strain ATCC 11539 / FP-39264 / Madison 617) TaxID=670483 RepID=S7QAF1_GLOTA|nr:uncharacterized protein GLOTRDRAFT_128303 [Gloeophyllum trabeum ATCC 11539]EPQ56358.1 hypothetical protein GLOTRDRAFT_128303 [Gloeophyllum trabeum ATCC 11539]
MSVHSTQPFTAAHLTNAFKGLATCHANGESVEGLVIKVETYMLHFIEQSSDMVSAHMTTVTTTPVATSGPAITLALGRTCRASKRAHKEAVSAEKAVEDDTQPKPCGCSCPKGMTKVQYVEAQTACRGCMERKIQCHVPISGQVEVCQECAQKKTWCSFADGRGLQAESSEEVEEVNEVVVGRQQLSPKKP